MKLLLGIICAIVLHAGFIFLGGILFFSDEEDHGRLQSVQLLSEDDVEKEEQKREPEDIEELETEVEQPPDAAEIIQSLETPAAQEAPALEAASLSAIEAALNGQGAAGGEFASALAFTSGGVIGGKGKAGSLDEKLEDAFSLAEIDQKPRAIFQAAPTYPNELRSKKLEGVVSILFVVDAAGKVSNPRVEKSSHVAFDKPALDAVKKWKFEPAIKGGQRVACKMRVPIRFQPS